MGLKAGKSNCSLRRGLPNGDKPHVLLVLLFGFLALLSAVIFGWQLAVAREFPLHTRLAAPAHCPGISVLKPLKDADEFTPACLRSWLEQDYGGPVEILFGVVEPTDPACGVVLELLKEFPDADARLVFCPDRGAANAKVGILSQLEAAARHGVVVVSDADVAAPDDLLAQLAAQLDLPGVGLVTCPYRTANPATVPMKLEAVAVNADFWSQVLQARSLGPQGFALGATMALRRTTLEEAGGFAALEQFLADDFLLGRRVAEKGGSIALCPVVVDCWDPPQDLLAVWRHQLRWARTIRTCLPQQFAASICNNVTLWAFAFDAAARGNRFAFGSYLAGLLLLGRIVGAWWLQRRMGVGAGLFSSAVLVPAKDLLNVALWVAAFAGNRVTWRGVDYSVAPDGRLTRLG